MRCEGIDLNVNVLLAPGGKSRQPILFFDRLLDAWPLFGREYARCGRERRTGDFASDGASSDSHLGIIPNTFVFSGVAACLHIQLVVCFSKPHGGRNRYTSFAEGGEADVLLALNFARDGHRDIVREGTDLGVLKIGLHAAPEIQVFGQVRFSPLDLHRETALTGLVRL